MSIRKMIALHPDVAGHVNQPLGDAAHHLMYCARMCLSCADACAAEKMDMRQCIRTCLDCSDVCEATGISNDTVRNKAVRGELEILQRPGSRLNYLTLKEAGELRPRKRK